MSWVALGIFASASLLFAVRAWLVTRPRNLESRLQELGPKTWQGGLSSTCSARAAPRRTDPD